jgi:multisubunit Na+/H+ antiporter MnhG subunit
MEIMEIVGWVAVVIAALFVLFGTLLGLRSIPDARRYFRIRRM